MRGVVGQKWRTSGYHCDSMSDKSFRNATDSMLTLSMTFSNELGQSMAKQTKRRSVSG